MFSIAPIALAAVPESVTEVWKNVVESVAAWLVEVEAQPRQAVILLPQVRHLQLAREAWSRWVGGWLPRIETPQTLSGAWAPAQAPMPGMISFDVATDRLTALSMLRSASLTRHSDPLALDHAVNALVQTAHGMARAAGLVSPDQRALHWQACRELLSGPGGPAGRERALAQLALEWAALQPPPRTDALFPTAGQGEAAGISAWVMVQAGGVDPLANAVLQAAANVSPCAVVNLDGGGAMPADMQDGALSDTDLTAEPALPGHPAYLRVAVCDDFEEEAQRSAAQVLHHLAQGQSPVVLVAQDRVLVRRVQALLARQAVSLQDETGWKLSTTTAAAQVMAWLRALRPQAGLDDVLDALKQSPHWEAQVVVLEGELRRRQWRRLEQVQVARLAAPAAQLWQEVMAMRANFPMSASLPLPRWLALLSDRMRSLGLLERLNADPAGTQVLNALRLSGMDADFEVLAHSVGVLDLSLFVSWVDQTLESASFVPEAPSRADVVVTPLSHAVLRPFAAAVFPGADASHWGPPEGMHPLLTPAQAAAFGLPTPDMALAAQWQAMRQLTRVPRLTLLRRLNDVDEHLLPSPMLERLLLLYEGANPGVSAMEAPDVRECRWVSPAPVHASGPAAASLLPARLSASAYEALRTCPYQFFALRMLQLQSVDELELVPDKRDYGNWLHTILQRFHAHRTPGTPRAQAQVDLRQAAHDSQALQGWDDAEFLPYVASFERLIEPYLDWLDAREVQGIHWIDGEREVRSAPPAWGGVMMHGIIDRLDRVQSEPPTLQLIDYKTGRASALRQRVGRPTEETQLAFYAALIQSQMPGENLRAAYLPLEEGRKLAELAHPDVMAAAERLVEGIGNDLARLREGAPLWPLGQGNACDFCAARGVCRRDHWDAPVSVPVSLETPP